MGGDRLVSRTRIVRVLTLVALAGALGLAGCGRKSALDPPPSAQAVPTPAGQPTPSTWRAPSGIVPDLTPTQPPAAAAPTPARNRSFPLDPLLN